jgi:hypothetical protein
MTILAMCEGGMAGRRLRWRGLAGVTGQGSGVFRICEFFPICMRLS